MSSLQLKLQAWICLPFSPGGKLPMFVLYWNLSRAD